MTGLAGRVRPLWRDEVLPWLREPARKPLRRQLAEACAMWRRDRYPPLQYLRSRLYRDDGRDPDDYVATGLLMKLRAALNEGVDPGDVVDKRRFARRMETAGLPAVREVLTTDGAGGAVSPEGTALPPAEARAALEGADADALFVKPVDLGRGAGAFVWRRGDPLGPVLEGRPKLVQPLLRQCEALARLHPASLNAVRVDTLALEGRIETSAAMLRIGGGGACVDTAAGGLIAPVDVATGRIDGPAVRRPAADPMRAPHAVHPETGARIEGVRIPFWDAVLDAIARGARALAPLRTLGWDVAVTPEGPVLIEANQTWTIAAMQIVQPLGRTPLARAARAYHRTGRLPDA